MTHEEMVGALNLVIDQLTGAGDALNEESFEQLSILRAVKVAEGAGNDCRWSVDILKAIKAALEN